MTWIQRVQMVLTPKNIKKLPYKPHTDRKLHTVTQKTEFVLTQKTEMFVFQWDVNVNVLGGKTIDIMYLPNGKWDDVDLCI